jgi:hypothetical protein
MNYFQEFRHSDSFLELDFISLNDCEVMENPNKGLFVEVKHFELLFIDLAE